MLRKIIVVLAATVIVGASSARATPLAGNPHCPLNDPGKYNWIDYMSKKYDANYPPLSIVFNRNIGTIVAGRYYTVTYTGNGSWRAAGYNSAQNKNIIDPLDGEPVRGGAPVEQYKMNIWGVMLQFNKAGEVYELYDKKFDRVGTLYCILQ